MPAYDQLDFLLFSRPGSGDDLYDLYLDLGQRHYHLEHLDAEMEVMEDPLEGNLRRSRVNKLRLDFEKLGLLDWPYQKLDEVSARGDWPLIFNFVDDLDDEEYYCMGDLNDPSSLDKLHRLLEEHLGITFGLRG